MNHERMESAESSSLTESPLDHDRRAFFGAAAFALASLFESTAEAGQDLTQKQKDEIARKAKEEMMKKQLEKISGASFEELFEFMNHKDQLVRSTAQGEVRHQVMRHIEQEGHMQPVIQDYYAGRFKLKTEPARLMDAMRLEFIMAQEKFMLTGTKCTFPKEEMSVKDWLECISRQVDRPVNYYGAETSIQNEIIRTKPGTVWEVLNAARLPKGRRFVVYASGPTCIDLNVKDEADYVSASKGAVTARVDTNNGYLYVNTEPRVDSMSVRVVSYRERLPDGSFQTVEDFETNRTQLPISKNYGKANEPMHIEVTLELQPFVMQKHIIAPLNKPANLDVGFVADGTIRYEGIDATKTLEGHHQAVMAVDLREPLPFILHSRCAVAHEDGIFYNATIASMDPTNHLVNWQIGKTMPKKMTIYTPTVLPSSSVPTQKFTFVFERKALIK